MSGQKFYIVYSVSDRNRDTFSHLQRDSQRIPKTVAPMLRASRAMPPSIGRAPRPGEPDQLGDQQASPIHGGRLFRGQQVGHVCLDQRRHVLLDRRTAISIFYIESRSVGVT